MEDGRNRLSVIGKIIGILREERRGNSQNRWTQKKFCENICSPNTLKSIESGGVSRSVEVYVALLEKFDLKFRGNGAFPEIDRAIDKLTNEIYVAIEYFNNQEINALTTKAIRILEIVKEYVYYAELYEIMKDIKAYYIDDELIDNVKVDRYTKELHIFPSKISDVLRVIIFARAKLESMSDKQKYKNLIERLELTKSDYPCIKLILLHYYFVIAKNYAIIKLIKELEHYFIERNNTIRLLDVYNYAIIFLSLIDFDEALVYSEKVENMLSAEVAIPKGKIFETYSNLASSYYNKQRYAEALENYEKMIQLNGMLFIPNLLSIADCQNRLGQEIDIPIVEKEEFRKYPSDIQTMYNYFMLKDVPLFIKQNYIMKRILPSLNDLYFVNIFRYELNLLVGKTNQYKVIYTFDKMIEAKFEKQ